VNREPPEIPVQIACLTDPGRKRTTNEDAVSYHIPGNREEFESRGILCIVADGMGGHDAGEVASATAVEAMLGAFLSENSRDPVESLRNCVTTANRKVYETSRSSGSQSGMGTTLVAAMLRGNQLHVANVGDSRAYRIRGGEPEQITTDHSWVQEQILAGVLTKEALHTHPRRNLITRALGIYPGIEVDYFSKTVRKDDVLVLCSDGLWGEVRDDEIARAVEGRSVEEAAQVLVDLANERGGPDNISVVVARVLENPGTIQDEQPETSMEEAAGSGKTGSPVGGTTPFLSGVGAFILIGLVVLIIYLMRK